MCRFDSSTEHIIPCGTSHKYTYCYTPTTHEPPSPPHAASQPVVFGAMIVGEMGGMALPGILYDVYGSYTAALLISFFSTTLTVGCFVLMAYEHPLEPRKNIDIDTSTARRPPSAADRANTELV